jgi:hypothetical protein
MDQEYNNPDHLPLRTTALTQVDGDIRTRAHKLCCEYLRGAWKGTTAQDFVIRKISTRGATTGSAAIVWAAAR